MIAYNPREPLISLHVPKCGGTSFERALKQWFGRYLFYHYHHQASGTDPQRHNLKHRLFRWRYKRGVCVHGHFNHFRGYGVADYYPDSRQFITILRDPFDLHRSNYFFGKRFAWFDPDTGIKATTDERYGNIDRYFEQTESYMMNFLPRTMTLENYQAIIETRFVFIGTVEAYQQSLDILSQRLGKPPVSIGRANTSVYNESLSDEARTRARFREQHPLEYAIYDYVTQRLAQM